MLSDTFKHSCIDNLNAQGISELDNYNLWITTTYLDTVVINLDKKYIFLLHNSSQGCTGELFMQQLLPCEKHHRHPML